MGKIHTTALLAFALVSASPALGNAVASFGTDQTSIDLGETQAIAFVPPAVSDEDRTFSTEADNSDILEVLRPGEVLAGQAVGFFRVRGLVVGTTDVRCGDALIRVTVVDRGRQTRVPRIVSPVGGSAVWGVVGLSVEIFDAPGRDARAVFIEASDGSRLVPASESPPTMGPHRRVYFEFDSSAYPVEGLVLTPVAEGPGDAVERGNPLALRIVRPQSVVEGEGEAEYDVERPERFGRGNPKVAVGRDENASGGAFRSNAGAYPPLCYPVTVDRAGEYQVVLRVAGDMGGAALPTVALFVDNEDYPRMSARLASERWHRMPLGGPITLEAGEHVLTAFFVNDFYVGGLADRNLRIDTIEVARLADGPLSLPTLGLAKTGNALMDAQRDAMSMAMTASAMAGGTGEADHMGIGGSPLRIAFDRVLDGAPIAGQMEIKGLVHAVGALEAADPMRVPVVTLMINGEVASSQRTLAPRFWVDAPAFQSGDNTLQLVAELEGGAHAATPIQTMHYDIEPGPISREARRTHRFGVRDERWGEDARERLARRGGGTEQLAFAFMSTGTATLELPEGLSGAYELFLTARGEGFEGPPIARVELDQAGENVAVGEFPIPGGWRTERLGEIELSEGPKRLQVSFINDHYVKDVGDRNLLIQGVILRELIEHEDTFAPLADITHPRPGDTVYLSDALVATIRDDVGIKRADLLVDGQMVGSQSQRSGRDGLVVLPIAARSWGAGEHTLSVRVIDQAGNIGESAPVVVTVPEGAPQTPTRYARAQHVLDRFGFGPDQRQLARVLEVGEREWLIEQLDTPGDDPAELAAVAPGLIRFPTARNAYETPRRAIQHAMRTQRPARVRLVLWVNNHFSTWIRKVQGDREWGEYVLFHDLGATSFARLLLASSQSPAMLAYLDQSGSFAGRLNENYAREIMELHTLGVDRGYTQQDVTNLARLLTGTLANLEGNPAAGGIAREYNYRFDPALNDGSAIELLGARFEAAARPDRYDRVLRAIEILAAHPNTAEHISTKLAEHYVGLPADEELVSDLTRVFRETGGDLRELLLVILDHKAFWDSMDTPRMRQPLEYALRLSRLSEDQGNPWRIGDFLQRCGTQLFDRSTPDGYPEEDEAYANSNAMIQRWSLANDLRWILASRVPNPVRWTDPDQTPGWDQLVVDYLAIGVTGEVLGDRSNAAALEYLGALEGNSGERVLTLAPFIAQLPEANLK